MKTKYDKPNKTTTIVNSMYWWLSIHRSFFINDEYKIELLEIKRNSGSVKVRITNLKDQTTSEKEVSA